MRIYFMVICFFFFAGCSDNDLQLKQAKSIKFDYADKKLNKIEINKSFTFVELETKEDNLIEEISKLYISKNGFVIFDRINSSIKVFDKQGKYLRSIGAVGNQITDIVYYDDKEEIEVFSIHNRKLICYKLTGEILYEKKSEFDFISFYKVKDGYWIYGCFDSNGQSTFGSKNEFNLLLVSNDFRTIKATFCKSKNFFDRRSTYDNFHENSKGELFFQYGLSDIIYKLKGDEAIPYLFLDFGKNKVPYEKITNMSNHKEFENEIYRNKVYEGSKANLQIGDRLISFGESKYSLIGTPAFPTICFIQDLNYKKYSNIDISNIPNVTIPTSIKKGKVVFSINPRVLTSENIKEINKIYSLNISPNSNPLLLITNEKDIL